MGYKYPGAEYIDDTVAHTGRFGKIVATENSVIASLTAMDYSGNTLSAIPLNASCEMEGVFTSITLTSGTVIAYKL
jgi:formyltetrahydrofolate synthetase